MWKMHVYCFICAMIKDLHRATDKEVLAIAVGRGSRGCVCSAMCYNVSIPIFMGRNLSYNICGDDVDTIAMTCYQCTPTNNNIKWGYFFFVSAHTEWTASKP